jgi:hypothetical protein
MQVFHIFLNSLIISSLFTLIISPPSYEEYSSVFLDKIRIGSQSKEISLILNTLSSKTLLFTNSKRPYAQEIQRGRKSDVLIDKVSFAGEKIESFPFNLGIDETKLNNKNIQGEFGLGIDKEKTNDLIDILFENQMITKKVIELDLEEGDKEDKVVLNLSPNTNDFTYCDLSNKNYLDTDDYYYESWICKLSHIVIGSTKAELVWNNTIEVKGEVAFDSRTKYIYVPKDYMKYITNLWDINSAECKLVHELASDEKYYSCSLGMKNRITSMHSIYFIIGGFGYRLKAQDLFENDGKHLNCVIRFFNDDKNLWILGVPFLREYKAIFDFEYAKIGFKGGNILNFKQDYEKWSHEVAEKESQFFNGIFEKYSWEKIIMIIGTIVGTLIILYVMFWFCRNCKRQKSKYHIELNEQYNKKEYYH